MDNSPFPKIDMDRLFGKSTLEEKKSKEPAYIETFQKKYFSVDKYYFFKSIFEYITVKKAFNIEVLKTELDEYFIIMNGEIAEQDKILNNLGYHECLKLSDKEYQTLTYKMLKFLDEGIYQLRQYSIVFIYAIRFDNLLNFNFQKLKKRFKKGIKKEKRIILTILI